MLKIVDGRSRLAEAQRLLKQHIQGSATWTKRLHIGFPGGKMETKVCFVDGLDLWWAHYEFDDEKHWNAFGIGAPKDGVTAPDVEVNPPIAGINRRIRGLVAEDEEGHLYLLHRGALGGGKKGVGGGFLSWYPKSMRRVVDEGEREIEAILVGRLDAPRFIKGLRGFVALAKQYREEVKDESSGAKPNRELLDEIEDSYYDEPQGKSKRSISERELVIEHIHGRVVAALKDQVLGLGHKVANDKPRDLYIPGPNGQALVLFEVKASADSQSLYTGVGQLFWHRDPSTSVVLVVPDLIGAVDRQRIKDLGIHVVTWDEREHGYTFQGLSLPPPASASGTG